MSTPSATFDLLPARPSIAGGTARALLLLTVALATFVWSLSNPFLWDDVTLLTQRLAPGGHQGLVSLWRTPYWGQAGPADTYRPLGVSVIYLERLAFGIRPLGYHCVSLGLHVVVCLLAWQVLSRLAGSWAGFVAALLFAAHPVHAEAVGMVYGQLELLSAMFVLAGLGLYDIATESRLRPVPYALAVLCGAAAVCSKESGAMLPALLMVVRVYRYWQGGNLQREGSSQTRGNWQQEGGFQQGGSWRSAGVAIWRGLPGDLAFWAVVGAYLLVRHSALGSLAPTAAATVAMDYPLRIRLNLPVVSVGEAVLLCVFPTGQTLYYGHLRDALFSWPVSQAAWLIGAALALWWLRPLLGRAMIWLAGAWFCVMLFPVSNVIPSGVVVAERTLYLPALGVCLLAAAALRRTVNPRRATVVVGALVVIGVLAGNRVVRQWRDDLTLWRSTVAAHERSPLAQLELGKALVLRWEVEPNKPVPPVELAEAERAFRRARELNSSMAEALSGSGWVALRRGDRAAAEALFEQALALNPRDAMALRGLQSTGSR